MLQRSAKRRPQTWRTCIPPFPDGGYPLQPWSWSELQRQKIDLLFLATPHEVSRALVPEQSSRIACGRSQRKLGGCGSPSTARFTDSAIPMRLRCRAHEKAVYGLSGAEWGPLARRCPGGQSRVLRHFGHSCLGSAAAADIVDREKESFLIRSPASPARAKKRLPARTFVAVADNLSAYSVFGHRQLRRNS